MKPRRLHFTTRTWFQLCMMPALAVVTLGLSWSVYRALHAIILRSFEHKLTAVSTATAAFIKPADHHWLMQQPAIRGLAFSPDDVLFALDGSRSVLMRIRPTNGVAEERLVSVPAGLRDLAFHREAGSLVALELPSGRLFTLDPETGAATFRLSAGEKARGLAAAPGGYVTVFTDRLLRLDLTANRLEPVSDVPLPEIAGAGFDADRNVYWALDTQRRILKIDPATGQSTVSATLADDAPLPGDFAYDRRRHILLGSSRSILKIDPETGKIEPAHFVPAFGKELTPVYRNYAFPMRRVMNQLDLSYLYSFIVVDRTRIVYGLDGTQGERHSPLQSEENVPEEQIEPIQELLRSGTLYQSPIQRWQQWGSLKSTFAPVFDATGKTIAMTGADVEVSLIERQTRRALVELFTIGIGSLILASGVSIVIARRLRRPLEQIKSTALEVAAGNYTRRSAIAEPREAHALAETFNHVAASLETDMQALNSSIGDLLRNRDRYELGRRLAQPHEPGHVLGEIEGAKATWSEPAHAAISASGAVRHGTRAVIWLADSPADPLQAARRRADLALRVSARLRHVAAESASLPLPGQTIAPFAFRAPSPQPARAPLPAGVTAAVVIDIAQRSLHALGAPGAIEELPDGGIRFGNADLSIELTGFTVTLVAT